MSELRRKRQEDRTKADQPISKKNAGIGVAIVVLLVAGLLVKHKLDHKHDAFAKCLKERNVVMYGAYWCPHCVEQKELFGASFEYVKYVECGIPGNTRGETQDCKDAGVKLFPTWQFPPVGERHEGNLSLEELSDRSGCALP